MTMSLALRLRRLFLATLLVLPGAALRAQLDTRLQTTNSTDFLDLYQQSTSARVKPEIATVFDFSGSMQALMYHPLFSNTDTTDSNSYNQMTFSLVTSGKYTVYAYAAGNSSVYQSITFTLGSKGATTSGSRSGSTYSLTTITSSLGSSTAYSAGTSVTFTTTFKAGSSTTLYWYAPGCTPAVGYSTGSSSGTSCTFTITVPSATSYVLSSVSGTATSSGGVGTLRSGILVKPDGTQVTSTNAAAADSTSGQYGISMGSADVRNWIRAASHVRFSAYVGSTLRTVDLPIPWKIMDSTCSGNPVSSLAVTDSVTVTNTDSTTTTYGSGGAMELDLSYSVKGGSYVFCTSQSGDASTSLTSTTLYPVWYKNFYVDWLFQGTYGYGSYKGSYVVFDAANASLAGGQGALGWGQGFGSMSSTDTIKVPQFNYDGSYASAETTSAATVNLVPARTRTQAVKEAAIRTWIKFQGSVYWAFRFLDTVNEASSSSASTINYSSTASWSTSNSPLATRVNGADSAWTVLNNTSSQGINASTGNSVTGMKRIAAMFALNGTPLTYAMARTLAQFSDPGSVFNAVETSPSQCENHFLILFTDGLDNNNSSNNNSNYDCPYLPSSGTTGSALAGNQKILASKTAIDRTGTWWNLFTFAGIGAHLADPSLGTAGTDYMVPPTAYPTGSATPSGFLPYAITSRKNPSGTTTTFSKAHRISTMTVGVSLSGSYNDSSSPKSHLFKAAAVGDVTIDSWDISALKPFALADESDPTLGRKSGTINFFDATNPTLVTNALYNAFIIATLSTRVNATANPNLPYIGSTLGNQIYLGKFQPPANGGPIWSGDLMMFDTKTSSGTTVLLDASGNEIGTEVTAANAVWSAANNLYNNRNWKARTLYTRIPGTASTPEPGLMVFSDVDNFPSSGTNAYTTLKPYVATGLSTDTEKKTVMQLVMGGNTSGTYDTSYSPSRPASNRTTIMGDVIDSSPVAVEYTLSDWTSTIAGNSQLGSLASPEHFRLVLVGTNQGWLHAFGEVSRTVTATDPSRSDGSTLSLVSARMDELWSFMPTDFLANLDQINVTTNPHRFMVDGTPTVYALDLPSSSGGSSNGTVDSGERALVLFGLRKGGRSYYCLDIHDPFNPAVKWSLVPDEVAANGWPSSRVVTGGPSAATVAAVVAGMGFSTCTPAIGRILFNGIYKDAVFFGGGYSNSAVEANFSSALLGRSVLALDVYTGAALAAVDLTATSITGTASTLGPIASSVVPFEFILNSGLAQRAYFLDLKGGLWCWGSKGVVTTSGSAYQGYRSDTSELTRWTTDGTTSGSAGIRKVYQDSTANPAYTTDPAPFRLGWFPGAGRTSSLAAPAAVGIAVVSGNRNNPLDYYYTTATRPYRCRATMVFDRQDSRNWSLDTESGPDTGILDSNLLDVTDFTISDSSTPSQITPGGPYYFLAPSSGDPYFGYTIYFPTWTTAGFLPKGINSPIVVSRSLYYSYFTPTDADPCTGGSGATSSCRICDLLYPAPTDTRTNSSCTNGLLCTWSGVASNYVAIGTTGVIQGGMVTVSTSSGTSTAVQVKTLKGQTSYQHPKIRVWRTVQ
jgi:hypothetical protein